MMILKWILPMVSRTRTKMLGYSADKLFFTLDVNGYVSILILNTVKSCTLGGVENMADN